MTILPLKFLKWKWRWWKWHKTHKHKQGYSLQNRNETVNGFFFVFFWITHLIMMIVVVRLYIVFNIPNLFSSSFIVLYICDFWFLGFCFCFWTIKIHYIEWQFENGHHHHHHQHWDHDLCLYDHDDGGCCDGWDFFFLLFG